MTPQCSNPYTGPTAEDLDHIPAVMKSHRQWILWRGADRVDKHTGAIVGIEKIPINPAYMGGVPQAVMIGAHSLNA